MKNLTRLLAGLMIGLGMSSVHSLAQSTSEPYTFTTLAGLAGSFGTNDGTGIAARFNKPSSVAVDGAGIVYVADTGNHTIRKITAGGVVTTLAGLAGSSGSADGTNSAARFNGPSGVAVDGGGNVFVTDGLNCTVRKIDSGGDVMTLAGLAGKTGSIDGVSGDARFGVLVQLLHFAVINGPNGVAVDMMGNAYVTDTGNNTIRKMLPEGAVTTVAGLAGSLGNSDGTGSEALFYGPCGPSVDRAGNLFVADPGNHTIRIGYPQSMPSVILTSGLGFGSKSGQFGFTFLGPAGQPVVIESSTNLETWLPIWTNSVLGSLNFSDSESGHYSNRFYRIHLP
jgi:hypothetical protein